LTFGGNGQRPIPGKPYDGHSRLSVRKEPWKAKRAKSAPQQGYQSSERPGYFARRCTVPVPSPSDLATFKIPMPFASCFRTLRSVALFTSAGRARRARPGVLSCPAMVSIRTVCCHCLAKARVCPTAAVRGDHTGETMAQLL